MKLLIVEDDINLSEIMQKSLQDDGYAVDCCDDGGLALDYIKQYDYDCLILDRMLPTLSGIELLKTIRKQELSIAVIIVTAMDGVTNRIDGLDAGADDYLAKPFDLKELSARVRAMLRRPRGTIATDSCSYQGLTLSRQDNCITFGAQKLEISKKESALLEYFLLHPGETLGRERILTRVWGSDSDVTEGNLDNYIYFLRRRFRALNCNLAIRTVHGMGYRLESEVPNT